MEGFVTEDQGAAQASIRRMWIVSIRRRVETHLSLDGLDLILETGDHAVQLSDLRLGCAQVVTILSSRGLHLLILL